VRYSAKPLPARSSFEVVTPPSWQILTTADVRKHLRLPNFPGAQTDTEEDGYIESLIAAAGESIEASIYRPVRAQVRDIILDRSALYESTVGLSGGHGYGCRRVIVLNNTPIRSVDSITYTENGQTVTIDPADYRIVGEGQHITRKVEIYFSDTFNWPWTYYSDDDLDLRIRVSCGWATVDDLPPNLVHACRLIVDTLHNMRNELVIGTIVAKVPRSADFLLSQFRRQIN